ncbi:MAG: HD domain-containing protein [Parcubacteria group bacterium]|nr:HD domain-containing protein [Parcubacteria group bacterium]
MRVVTIEDFLSDIISSWRGIRRWQGKPNAEYEDDLMHSFKTAIQALVVLSLEENEEIKQQKLEILTLALNHDVSEACLGGDVIKPIKKRLGEVVDQIEAEEFDRRFSLLPPVAAKFLKTVNHLQGNFDVTAGRFFDAIEYLGYTMFALLEVEEEKSKENSRQFKNDVLKNSHKHLVERCEEFESFKILYEPFAEPYSDKEPWNIEQPLRQIINAWESSRAWPEFPSTETVLGRTMKTAMLASILIPIEMEKRKRRKEEERIDGFIVLSAALVHNFAKSTVGVLPHRLKTHPKFERQVAREIEREYFLKIIDEFPESARELMTQAFDLEHNTESLEGKFFEAIKLLSYATFALHEYSRGNEQYEEVLSNCLPKLLEYNGEFKSFDMFFNLIKPRVESIVEGKSRIWVEVK